MRAGLQSLCSATPIEKADANTSAVFGDYISVYDIQRAVQDGATVPIYYESRLTNLVLKEEERPKIDSPTTLPQDVPLRRVVQWWCNAGIPRAMRGPVACHL